MSFLPPDQRDSSPIDESVKSSFVTRVLESRDTQLIQTATQIHNVHWEEPLRITQEVFGQWVGKGVVFGILNQYQGNSLVGTLACNRLSLDQFNQGSTYNEITANGTLENYDSRGNVLVPFAITTIDSPPPFDISLKDEKVEKELRTLALKNIVWYAYEGSDRVLKFHKKPKGGFEKGASVYNILLDSRPEDRAAMGISIALKYPELLKGVTIVSRNPNKPNFLLIEEAMRWAIGQGIPNIMPFSRPSGFRDFLLRLQG